MRSGDPGLPQTIAVRRTGLLSLREFGLTAFLDFVATVMVTHWVHRSIRSPRLRTAFTMNERACNFRCRMAVLRHTSSVTTSSIEGPHGVTPARCCRVLLCSSSREYSLKFNDGLILETGNQPSCMGGTCTTPTNFVQEASSMQKASLGRTSIYLILSSGFKLRLKSPKSGCCKVTTTTLTYLIPATKSLMA